MMVLVKMMMMMLLFMLMMMMTVIVAEMDRNDLVKVKWFVKDGWGVGKSEVQV